ncbi:MAG: polyisoprenyl-phosphate glycosyltransferase [Solirubrobacteraceae bacterium]|nr:polyisoprenyl-phosphate glycosyltransferase [Solirubrobacteraceae bacterium]
MPSRKLISLVIPAYNETECVDELGARLAAVFDSLPEYDFEAIIVENGSFDDTMDKLEALHERADRFKIVQLARNFLMDGGLTAGLAYVQGDAAILMTADLQDPPEVIPEFIAKWEEGYDHVHGIVTAREGTGPIRRMNSNLFYLVAGRLTDGRIPRNVSDFRLIDRRVVDTINAMEERNRFMRGLFSWVGFKTTGVEHRRLPRHGGESKAYTFGVLGFAVRGILAHSYVPLRIISGLGIALSGLSLLSLVALTLRFFLVGVPFPGFGTLICVMILLFGMLFSILGVVAEYIGLIYEEVKQRPNFVVRRELGIDVEHRAADEQLARRDVVRVPE